MTDHDVRDFLERMAAEEPVQFLDAEPLARRARRRAARTAIVGTIGVAAAIAVLFSGVVELREASPRIPVTDPTAAPRPSPAPGFSTFSSALHGITIDYPAGWEVRPATEPWATGEPLDFDSQAADVFFDPALGDRVYMVVASQPYDGLTEDEWRDSHDPWLCAPGGHGAGSGTVDRAEAWFLTCGSSTASAAIIFTDTRGYMIRLVVPFDEPKLRDTYDWDWHKVVLETVDLRPEEALDEGTP